MLLTTLIGLMLLSGMVVALQVRDPDGDPLFVTHVAASSGTVTLAPGGVIYTPDPDVAGAVQITYTVTDGKAVVAQTAHVIVQAHAVTGPGPGTDGPDDITGTAAAETIIGGEGDDVIRGGGGDDDISGGAGADLILGGAGDDVIHGNAGADRIDGGAGDDLIFGGTGDDVIQGGGGDDVAHGDAGSDILSGDAGADQLFGGTGDDLIFGGADADDLHGDAGDDVIHGNAGNDVLTGGTGADVIIGGTGSDHVMATPDTADDVYHGDALQGDPAAGDMDILDFSAARVGIHIDLAAGSARGADTGYDTFESFEIVIAGSGDDHVTGSAGADVVADGTGHDTVSLETGNDCMIVSVDRTSDAFDGGAGQDMLDMSDHTIGVTIDMEVGTLDGAGTGHDTFESFEIVIAGSGDDHITGSAGTDVVTDGAGRDTVDLGAGNDRMVVSVGRTSDAFDGGAGQDTLDLSDHTIGVTIDMEAGTLDGTGTGHDTFESFETVIAGSGNDRVTGSAGADVVRDGAGRDTVDLGARNDRMIVTIDRTSDAFDGGAGQDTLDLSNHIIGVTVDMEAGTLDGADTDHDTFESFEIVIAGSGDDSVTGSAGADIVADGAGADTVALGSGDDVMVVTFDMKADTFDGGAGQDRLDLSDHEIGVTVDLTRGTVICTDIDSATDSFTGFEAVVGSCADDVFVAGAEDMLLTGGGGPTSTASTRPRA